MLEGRRGSAGAMLLAMALMLGGCSGGDGGGGSQTSSLGIVGVWEGLFLGSATGASSARAVLLGGRLMMADDNDVVYDGTYQPVGGGGFRADTVRRVNANGQAMAALSVSGAIVPDDRSGELLSISMTAVGSTNLPENLQMLPSASYQQASSLSRVDGHWVDGVNPGSLLILSVDNASGNNISGQDGACAHSGVMSIPNAQRNLYAVSLFISGGSACPIGGQYTGFATLENDNLMHVMLANQSRGLSYTLVRQ